MKNKIALLIIGLLLQGCGYRFAITKTNICEHPERYPNRVHWGHFLTPRLNPLHWHKGIHEKCTRCGQKFCENWKRGKWLHKIK